MSSAARRGLWLSIYGIGVVFILSGYFLRYPLPNAIAKLRALLNVGFLLIGSYGAGTLLLRRLRIEVGLHWQLVFSTAMGLGLLSLATLLLGWAPIGTLAGRLGVLHIAWVLFFLYGLTRAYSLLLNTPRQTSSLPLFSALCLTATLGATSICLLSAFSPITYYDSLVYHLALPSYYLIEGKIAPAIFNLYSFFPANTEMLYLFILARLPEPESVINLTTFGFSTIVAMALFAWVKEEYDDKTAWLAVALWATMPAVLLLSIGGYIEIPLACYSLLSLRAFAVSQNTNNDQRWLLLSGLLSGFACATKYTGAITPIFLACYLLWTLRTRKQHSAKKTILFCGAVILPVLPWLIRNAVSIGNPFFPFFYRLFGGNVGWTEESAGAYFQMLTEYGARSSVFFELLSAPFDIAWNAAKFGGGFDTIGDFGWVLFIIAAPLGVWAAWKSPQKRWLIGYAVFHFILWFFTKPVLRFLIGVLPVAIFFSAIALKETLTAKKRIISLLTFSLVFLISLSNIFLYLFINDVFRPFQVPLGLIDRDTFLTKRLSFYEAYKHLNESNDKSRRVFLLGEQRTYHLAVPYVSASIFAPSPIAKTCNDATDWQRLDTAFKEQGITHLLIHFGEVQRLGGLKNFGFTDQGELILSRYLQEKCTKTFDGNRVSVYQIETIKPS